VKKIFYVLFFTFNFFTFIPNASAMQIYVKDITGKNINLEVESSDTIEAVKEKIKNSGLNILGKMVLTFNGRKMDDFRTLADYNVQRESTVHLSYTYVLCEIIIDSLNARIKYLDNFVTKIETIMGEDVIFSVVVDEGYEIESVNIDNGKLVIDESGKYILSDITNKSIKLSVLTKKIVDDNIPNVDDNIILDEEIKNPQTFDNFLSNIFIFCMSIICFLTLMFIIKKI